MINQQTINNTKNTIKMSPEEAEDLMDSIFPIGEERWVKLKYFDRKKVMEKFKLSPPNKESLAKFIKEHGYEVTAIGMRPEYEPQAFQLLELKKEFEYQFAHTNYNEWRVIEEMINKKIDLLISEGVKYPKIK